MSTATDTRTDATTDDLVVEIVDDRDHPPTTGTPEHAHELLVAVGGFCPYGCA